MRSLNFFLFIFMIAIINAALFDTNEWQFWVIAIAAGILALNYLNDN